MVSQTLNHSEERYKAFIATSTEGIWRVELEKPLLITTPIQQQINHFYKYGYLAECNDVMAKMYGLKKASDLIGARLGDMLIRSDKKNMRYLTDFITSGYKLRNRETLEIDKNNALHIFQNSLVGVVKRGMLYRAWGTQRDITEQKLTDERQQLLEKVSSTLVSSLDYHITLKEIGQLIVPYFADYCRIAVINDEKIIKELSISYQDKASARLMEELLDSYDAAPKVSYGIPSLLKHGKKELISHLTDEILEKYGTDKKVVILAKKIGLKSYMGVPLMARKQIIGAITFSSIKSHRFYTKKDLQFAEELAHRISMAIENAQLYQKAQEAIALRDDFISVASHELKTPLTSVKIFTQVLQRHAQLVDDKKASESLAKMDKQIDKLTELIYNLLNIAKIQSGRLEFAKKEFDFDLMVKDVADILQHMTANHKIVIVGETKKRIVGDEDRIGQVLSNLISNAIKYSPKADKVILTLTVKKNQLSVSVQDFGIGMAQKHLEKIFHRFYRVSGATDKTFPGLGIGLYISSEIIARHGGKLWAHSTPGKGSTFYLTLPLKQR